VFFRNNRAQGSSGAGLYVKNSTGSWLELAQNNGPQVPIGSVIGWALTSSVPTGWLECDGSSVSRTTYAELFAVIGTTYGAGDGSTTFTLPNFNGKHLRGTTQANLLGTSIGSNTASVPVPEHSHDMDHAHGMQHYHSVDHEHNTTVGNQSANHSHTHPHVHNATTGNQSANHTHSITHNHTANTSNSGSHFHSGWTDRLAVGPNGNYDIVRSRYWTEQYTTNNAGSDRITGTGNAANPSNDGNHAHSVVFNAQVTHNSGGQSAGHTHNLTTSEGRSVNSANTADNTTNSQSASHKHSVNVAATTNLSNAGAITANGGGRGNTDTNSDSTANTGSANASITIIPDSSYMRWMIKATGTQAATAADGDDILAEAREEVVTVELAGSGTLPTSSAGAAYYRVPWAATLTAVKANRNGTNSNGAVTIDVNEGGTSVLSTEITIDQNEATSLTAATPAVISDSAIANDALLTFDIDSANTSDEGPLTVTLYFTRED
jgi:microcystin-dependent protein